MIQDGEHIPLILQHNNQHKHDRAEMFHIDYLQIASAKIPELLMALKTENCNATRLLDVLVIAGETDP